jgi:hypothetical protein
MRTMLAFLLLVAMAWPGDEERRRVETMRDEAALLEQAGHHEEAVRIRAQAAELEGRMRGGDPAREALHHVELALVAARRAGLDDAAHDLERVAERLRHAMREQRRAPDTDFVRRNIDTLRLAREAFAETGRRDAADVIERAIHAFELALEGKEGALAKAPGDGDLAELLARAADVWRERKAPDRAERVQELAGLFARRARGEARPEDRLARLEDRLARLEERIAELTRRLEAR